MILRSRYQRGTLDLICHFDVRHSFVPLGRFIRSPPYFTMKLQLVSLFVLVGAPVAVSACEGECIVAITNAFLGNYSVPIQSVLEDIVSCPAILFYFQ
jgi:hypothetical protein